MHLSGLSGPLLDHAAVTYGVQFDSVINSSKYFHFVYGLLLVPDIMHDILGLQLHI